MIRLPASCWGQISRNSKIVRFEIWSGDEFVGLGDWRASASYHMVTSSCRFRVYGLGFRVAPRC
jgi:hypothetical protein